jgi:hypothetical protein
MIMTQYYQLATGSSPKRANFVTILAWFLILTASMFVAIGLLQNIMFHTIVPIDEVFPNNAELAKLPDFYRFFFAHIKAIVLASFLFSVFALVAAIALLKRKNWARITYIGIFILGIIGNIAGIVIQQMVFSSMIAIDAPADVEGFVQTTQTVMLIVNGIFALGMSTLFGWLAYKLMTPAVRAEFVPSTHADPSQLS